jgi:hypothetical protein
MTKNSNWENAIRIGGLRRFAAAITILNILGHSLLGFEQSLAHPLIALLTAYTVELALEYLDARFNGRAPRYGGGKVPMIDFLLSPHITAMAISMLTYSNERLLPVVFATTVACGSKLLFRIPAGRGTRHFLNPSNFGITVTLLMFPWVGIAPPYHFTENLSALGDWGLPAIIICSGSFLNARFTRRLPLIGAWLGGFVLQAFLRHQLLDASFAATLMPMTGVAFILYTFYMVTDPATTPSSTRGQIYFGAGVAATYGLLMVYHVVFGLFFALTIVCAVRGLLVYAKAANANEMPSAVPARTGIVLKES